MRDAVFAGAAFLVIAIVFAVLIFPRAIFG